MEVVKVWHVIGTAIITDFTRNRSVVEGFLAFQHKQHRRGVLIVWEQHPDGFAWIDAVLHRYRSSCHKFGDQFWIRRSSHKSSQVVGVRWLFYSARFNSAINLDRICPTIVRISFAACVGSRKNMNAGYCIPNKGFGDVIV